MIPGALPISSLFLISMQSEQDHNLLARLIYGANELFRGEILQVNFAELRNISLEIVQEILREQFRRVFSQEIGLKSTQLTTHKLVFWS